MTPEQIDRVFGRGRLKMVTGEHVEVFREAAAPGSRRRYTKRFLTTLEADFGQWTEREWRILARLIGHGIDCVPEVVQFDRGAIGGTRLVQTYDAGATVDQWATILPVARDGRMLRHVFEDCAHWWALAHHCLRALSAIHELSVVHLDIKGDNVCIPVGPPDFDPHGARLVLYPRFAELALIDFAFSLVSRESLSTALPIGWQTDYDYQSPRLLHALEAGRRGDLQPTRELDWRCDMYSLAAMLKRYLPDEDVVYDTAHATGWSPARAGAAKELILALREAHDLDASLRRPHQALMELTAARLSEDGMAASLEAGWTLARDAAVTPVAASPLTPLTRLAPSIRVLMTPRATAEPVAVPAVLRRRVAPAMPARPRRPRMVAALALAVAAGAIALAAPALLDRFRSPAQPPAVAQASKPPEPETPAPAAPSEPAAAAPVPGKREASPEPAAAAPAPGKRETSEPVAGAPVPERREASPPPRVADTRVAKAAASSPPSRSAPPAQAAPAAKPAPKPATRVASARAPTRIRFHEEPPSRIAIEPVATAPAQTQPAPAGAATTARAEPVTPAPASPEAPRSEPARPARTVTAPPRSATVDEPRGLVAMLFNLAGLGNRPMVPIEERGVTSPGASPRAPSSAPSATETTRSNPVRVVPPPIDVTYAQRPAPVDVAPPPPAPASVAVAPPPTASAPEVAPAAPPPAREPAPRAAPPAATVDFAAQARRTLAESVPYSASRAQEDVARVLWVAANANLPNQERNIVEAVRRSWGNGQVATTASSIDPALARQLGNDARQAYTVQRDVAQAFDLQLRAFGANPRDAETAGNLAFLYLRVGPPQPEAARQLVLYAFALGSSQMRASRIDDWNTLAVASALTGREADATNAFYVAVALTRSLDRTCKSALSAVDNYGDRLVVPVQAMMLRIRQYGRDVESPYCAWPPRWNSAKGYF